MWVETQSQDSASATSLPLQFISWEKELSLSRAHLSGEEHSIRFVEGRKVHRWVCDLVLFKLCCCNAGWRPPRKILSCSLPSNSQRTEKQFTLKYFYFAHCPNLPQKKKKDISGLCRQEGNKGKPAIRRGFGNHARNTLTGGLGASAHVHKYPLFTTSHPQ